MKPHIIVDASLPYLRDAITLAFDALFLPSQAITRQAILAHNAKGLLIRSVTKCNEQLLHNTPIRFIATATAGTDHIDFEFCKSNNIVATNAPGCNAASVAEYVFCALARIAINRRQPLKELTLGIVGVGNVGQQVLRYARTIGMQTLLCDPPKQQNEPNFNFQHFNELLSACDVITFHVPLTQSGQFPTYHMLNTENFEQLKTKPIIINAARGSVVNTTALLSAIENNLVSEVVIDCWENEPNINVELLSKATIATPHIAGFSAESKARGSQMVAQAIGKFFNTHVDLSSIIAPPPSNTPFETNPTPNNWAEEKFLARYIELEVPFNALYNNPEQFENLRVNYKFHHEPEVWISDNTAKVTT